VASAQEMLTLHVENQNLRRHCLAVGYVMRALAETLGGNPDLWEVLGILHDSDWEITKDTPEEHTKKTLHWLEQQGITSGPIVRALQSHNRKFTQLAEIEGIMEWALETCDELTGFIVAVALTRPSKLLADVTVESVLKKWKTKEFAKAVDRTHIEQCERELGIPLDQFILIALSTMQKHHDQLGL
jgi:putative nucleotidyltransferase with HDIG domain